MDVKKTLSILISITLLTACGKDKSSDSGFSKASTECSNQVVKNEKLIKWKSGRISRVLFKKDHPSAFRRYMKKHKQQIEFVEDNYRVQIPSDTTQLLSPLAGGFIGGENWGVENIRAKEVWSQKVRGDSVIVAVIDSGVDTNHPELSSQLYTNTNEIPGNNKDDDENGFVDDVHGYDFINNSGDIYDGTGHGTHVSGIIAASHSVGRVFGVAPNAKIMALDFFDDDGGGSVFDAIKAMNYAAKNGARVINASWGGNACSIALKQAIDDLGRQNILFVTAAGNDGRNIDYSPSYPASFATATQVTVGASTYENYTAGFSNYGNKVNLVAPGAHIFSTVPVNFGSYKYDNGTSMASPFVTGAAALLLSAFPQATPIQIKQALRTSVRAGPYPVETRGSVDVASAYDYLKQQFSKPLP